MKQDEVNPHYPEIHFPFSLNTLRSHFQAHQDKGSENDSR